MKPLLTTLSEIARETGMCQRTVSRKLARAGQEPDALLSSGRRNAMPLFLATRLGSIKRIVHTAPEILA
jgi:hypothetical protein